MSSCSSCQAPAARPAAYAHPAPPPPRPAEAAHEAPRPKAAKAPGTGKVVDISA